MIWRRLKRGQLWTLSGVEDSILRLLLARRRALCSSSRGLEPTTGVCGTGEAAARPPWLPAPRSTNGWMDGRRLHLVALLLLLLLLLRWLEEEEEERRPLGQLRDHREPDDRCCCCCLIMNGELRKTFLGKQQALASWWGAERSWLGSYCPPSRRGCCCCCVAAGPGSFTSTRGRRVAYPPARPLFGRWNRGGGGGHHI